MDEKRRPGRPKGQPKTGGRVAGVRNRATREREAHLSEMLLAERLTEDEIASLSAVQVLMRIMRAEVRAGDLAGAKQTAIALAPYQSARLASTDLHVSGSLDTRDPAVVQAELAEVEALMEAARTVN
jgi:hypothetical protein